MTPDEFARHATALIRLIESDPALSALSPIDLAPVLAKIVGMIVGQAASDPADMRVGLAALADMSRTAAAFALEHNRQEPPDVSTRH